MTKILGLTCGCYIYTLWVLPLQMDLLKTILGFST